MADINNFDITFLLRLQKCLNERKTLTAKEFALDLININYWRYDPKELKKRKLESDFIQSKQVFIGKRALRNEKLKLMIVKKEIDGYKYSLNVDYVKFKMNKFAHGKIKPAIHILNENGKWSIHEI